MYELNPSSAVPPEGVASLMDVIREESPDFWPFGLTPQHFKKDNLWVLQKESSGNPVGFVGWQERDDNGERVGMYSIGLLPEHRRKGLAKQALTRVLDARKPGVDRVEALVVRDNRPSQALASSLGVPTRQVGEGHGKEAGGWAGLGRALISGWDDAASMSNKGNLARMGASGAGTALGVDAFHQLTEAATKNQNFLDTWSSGFDSERIGKGLVNSLFGAAGVYAADKFSKGRASALEAFPLSLGGAFAKDLYAKTYYTSDQAAKALEEWRKSDRGPSLLPAAIIAGGLLSAGGLAYTALKNKKKTEDGSVTKTEAGKGQQITLVQSPDPGRVRVSLPTANPNDKETVIDFPINSPLLSKTLTEKIQRDIKRRLRHEAKSRVRTNNSRPLNEITHVL